MVKRMIIYLNENFFFNKNWFYIFCYEYWIFLENVLYKYLWIEFSKIFGVIKLLKNVMEEYMYYILFYGRYI